MLYTLTHFWLFQSFTILAILAVAYECLSRAKELSSIAMKELIVDVPTTFAAVLVLLTLLYYIATVVVLATYLVVDKAHWYLNAVSTILLFCHYKRVNGLITEFVAMNENGPDEYKLDMAKFSSWKKATRAFLPEMIGSLSAMVFLFVYLIAALFQ